MKKVTTKEFIWYAAGGLIIAFGLICVIFGIIGYRMTGPTSQNFIAEFEGKVFKKGKLDLRSFGLIIMAVGVIFSVVVLSVNAKKADREVEKKIRREQRIAAQANSTIEVKSAVEVVKEQPEESK